MLRLAGFGIVLAVAASVLYQVVVKDLLFISMGVGRELQPITDFPYQCRRIPDERLQACEDMWLSEKTRELFLACSDALARREWTPNMGRLNASGRGLNDSIIVMDIDQPTGDGFEYRVLSAVGLPSKANAEGLHLMGFTGTSNSASVLLYLINNKPSIDARTGALLNNAKTGANTTIELFQTAPRASGIMHLKTFAHQHITTPNNIAVVGPDEFYIANDHGPHKVGLANLLSPFLGTGDITYCNASACGVAATGFRFPNGLVAHPYDGRVYVPSTLGRGGVAVLAPQPDRTLRQVAFIDVPYALDNLAVDARGDIWAAALPKLFAFTDAFADPAPARRPPPSTVLRIRRTSGGGSGGGGADDGYEVEKVLEDGEGEAFPGTTTALHDAKTGRIFLSGIVTPFLTVCEPNRQ